MGILQCVLILYIKIDQIKRQASSRCRVVHIVLVPVINPLQIVSALISHVYL